MNYQQTARELLKGRQLIWAQGNVQDMRHDPDFFRQFVEMAVEFGATHIHIGRFPFRYGSSFLPDNDDPYASWCATSFNLLWTFPPAELQQWIPMEEARERQALMNEQMAELRRFNLKGVVTGIEPLWLPETVYRAHPVWRGPQCELGRIAKRPYFAPSIDEPEVLELYRSAMREVCTRYPEIDEFDFMSNDSGGGISWTPNIYPGLNGPAKWRLRDTGQRIGGWLSALQEGASEAGVQARIHLHSSGLSPEIRSATQQYLKEGLYLNWATAGSEPWMAGGASLGSGTWSSYYPVAGMAGPESFVRGLQNIYHNPDNDNYRVGVSVDDTHLERARTLLQAVLRRPEPGSISRAQILLAAAAEVCGGPEHAESLVDAWRGIESATHCVNQIRQKGFSSAMPFCGVGMRWITRPLVPQPQQLSDVETEYFRRYLFSVQPEIDKANFHFVFGKSVLNGESVMWMARWCLQEAYETLQGVRRQLNSIADNLEAEGQARLQLEAARTGAFACLVRNAQNVIRYQYALDVAHHPQFGWNVMDYDENIHYDQRGLQLRKIAREELDNTQELIELIEAHAEPVLVQARRPDQESVFMLGPALVDDLRYKMNIMLDHWQEYETLYPTTKVWEFEPAPAESEYRRGEAPPSPAT